MLNRFLTTVFIGYSFFPTDIVARLSICEYTTNDGKNQCNDVESATFYGYPVVYYEDVDFRRLELRKRTQELHLERSVFYDSTTNSYIKLWGPNFSRIPTFIRALHLGYYKDLASIKSIVIDRYGKCRGYITPSYDCANSLLSLFNNKYDYVCLCEVNKQNVEYQCFYNNILEISKKTSLYYLDFVPSNVVTDHTSYYLIDLESVFSIEELRTMYRLRYEEYILVLEHLPPDYARVIERAVLKNEEL